MNSITTLARRYGLLYAANSTATSITAPISTITEPTGDGVIECASSPDSAIDAGWNFNQLHFAFFGTTTANQTALARITGWTKYGSVWVPTPLMLLTLTLGAQTGVSGQTPSNSQLFADTIVATTAYTSAYELVQNASPDDTIAGVKLDVFGFEKVSVLFGRNSSSASVNGLYRGF